MTREARKDAFFPGQAPIDAYGNGGFRFADMSHRGSLLILPSGIYGWAVGDMDELSAAAFAPVFAERAGIELLLLGTGAAQIWPDRTLRQAFADNDLPVECMDTGAAVRTYNVLLAEARTVAAALIAVDLPR
ncbi:MAG TPA: MTH938/NDUFAF3 family protein [Aestuariivirgaceae bacterium]|nr:MTH938/NDUFAF3 family protein [Aestuariivirgaceae bacterium]